MSVICRALFKADLSGDPPFPVDENDNDIRVRPNPALGLTSALQFAETGYYGRRSTADLSLRRGPPTSSALNTLMFKNGNCGCLARKLFP